MGKVKGTIVVKIVKSLRGLRDPSVDPLPAGLGHYLTERVLSTNWYAEEDYLELMRALAGMLPNPGMDVWEWMGRDSARVDLEEIYKPLLRPNDPGGTLEKFDSFWSMRHDTGRVTVTVAGPGEAVVELADYSLISAEICRCVQGTIWQLLASSGASGIQVQKDSCRVRGAATCRWQVSWIDP